MTARRVESVLFHLYIGLVEGVMIFLKTIYRNHNSRSMFPSSTVNENGLCGIQSLENFSYLKDIWYSLIFDRNIHVLHSCCFDISLLFRSVVSQINNSGYSDSFEVLKFLFLWSRSSKYMRVHLTKFINLDFGSVNYRAHEVISVFRK